MANEFRANLEQQNIHTVETKTNEKHALKHKDNWFLKSVTHIPYHVQVHKTTNQLLKYQLLLNVQNCVTLIMPLIAKTTDI